MASPTFLGVIGTGQTDNLAGADNPLVLTTTGINVPAAVDSDQYCLVLVVMSAPWSFTPNGFDFSQPGTPEFDSVIGFGVSDDQGGGTPNTYTPFGGGFDCALTYLFGVPADGAFWSFGNGGVQSSPWGYGGCTFAPYTVDLTQGLPIGSQISIAYDTNPAIRFIRAALLMFDRGATGSASGTEILQSRTGDSTATAYGCTGPAGPAFGTIPFTALHASVPEDEVYIAMTMAGDVAVDGTVPMVASNSTDWGDPVDVGASTDCMDDGGLVTAIYVADGSLIDTSDGIGGWSANGQAADIVVIMPVAFNSPTPPTGGSPVFNNHIRLSD